MILTYLFKVITVASLSKKSEPKTVHPVRTHTPTSSRASTIAQDSNGTTSTVGRNRRRNITHPLALLYEGGSGQAAKRLTAGEKVRCYGRFRI